VGPITGDEATVITTDPTVADSDQAITAAIDGNSVPELGS
jgi:hypothetical protein